MTSRTEEVPTPVYAIRSGGFWYIARLALATEFSKDLHFADQVPVWSEVGTTAYICPWNEAEDVVKLPA